VVCKPVGGCSQDVEGGGRNVGGDCRAVGGCSGDVGGAYRATWRGRCGVGQGRGAVGGGSSVLGWRQVAFVQRHNPRVVGRRVMELNRRRLCPPACRVKPGDVHHEDVQKRGHPEGWTFLSPTRWPSQSLTDQHNFAGFCYLLFKVLSLSNRQTCGKDTNTLRYWGLLLLLSTYSPCKHTFLTSNTIQNVNKWDANVNIPDKVCLSLRPFK
jgi:hypothetical protein